MKILYFTISIFIAIYSAKCAEVSHYDASLPKNYQVSFDILLKLETEKYYKGSILQKNQDCVGAESEFAKAKEFYLSKKNEADDKRGILLYKELALKGHFPSLLAIGDICWDRNKFSLALRWRVLAFQTSWLLTGEHNVDALQGLQAITTNNNAKKQSDVKNFSKEFDAFLKYHPLQKNKDLKIIQSLQNLYLKDLIEKHVSKKDQELKASWFYDYYFENYATEKELFEEGKALLGKKKFDKAVYFLERSKDPTALYCAGSCYREGIIGVADGKPDYEEAARLYRASANHDALYNLAFMYHEGKIGSKEGKPDYEEAAKLYQQSATPEGFCNLGNLYRNGYIGLKDGKPDYEKAEALYLESKHPNAL